MRAAGVDVLLVGIDMKMELEDAACASTVSSNTNKSSYVTSWNTLHHHKRYIYIYRKRVREGGNASNVAIDVIIFTFYSDQLTLDVETGIVTK